MSGYDLPPGCTTDDIDRAIESPDEDMVRLDCGHWGTEDSAERIGGKRGEAVNCVVCGLRKAPRGRSVPLEMANSLCNWECSGYNQPPEPGELWPGEWDEHSRLVCGDCYQRAENIRQLFSGIELNTTIVALQKYGASQMGNHTLFDAFMQKLLDAQKVGRRCTRCSNRVAGDSRLCTACQMKGSQ